MSKSKTRDEDNALENGAEDLEEALKDGLDEAHAFLKRHWEERPLAVAATALGVGLVLGMLLGGRR